MVSKHILLLCVGLFLLSSSNSPEKLICKTWKVEKITFDEKPGLFTAEQRQGIADQLIKNATFSFQKNGTYTVTTNDINTSGSWFFVPGKKGFHTESDGIKADFKIQQL
ncbi:MAG: hypothetical protein JWO06_1342, partial [Bacteroidota bacterium]|nr:hypothetical protein [Bacteroidota bacterium]